MASSAKDAINMYQLLMGHNTSRPAWYGPTRYPEVEEALGRRHSAWTIASDTARALARFVVAEKPKRILEFGAGLSSIVIARAIARAGGGRLTSIEHIPEWCSDAWAEVERTLAVDACLVPAQLRTAVNAGGLYHRYILRAELLAKRAPFDFVYIDAPQSIMFAMGHYTFASRSCPMTRSSSWTIWRTVRSIARCNAGSRDTLAFASSH